MCASITTEVVQVVLHVCAAKVCVLNVKLPKAYSEDFRWRAVWLNIVKGMTYTEIAEVLFMSEKFVYRYLSQFHATGSVEPKDPSGDQNKGSTEFESFTVLQSILHKPTAYLEEV